MSRLQRRAFLRSLLFLMFLPLCFCGGGASTGKSNPVPPNPAPSIQAISPAGVVAGAGGLTLTVTGTNYMTTSVVGWNGNPRPTTYISARKLTAAIRDSDLTTAGTAQVSVTNPDPGGGQATSNFAITQADNPTPNIQGIYPAPLFSGVGDKTFTDGNQFRA